MGLMFWHFGPGLEGADQFAAGHAMALMGALLGLLGFCVGGSVGLRVINWAGDLEAHR
jgi:hypothetical protein